MFKTLRDLRDAYYEKDLPKTEKVHIDNDSVSLCTDADGMVFDLEPRELIQQALTLLDIPWTE